MPTAIEALNRQTGIDPDDLAGDVTYGIGGIGAATNAVERVVRRDREETDLDDVETGYDVAHLILRQVSNRRVLGATVDVDGAIVACDLERTIMGASTLTVTLHDPENELLREDVFDRPVDVRFDGTWFRLAQVERQAPNVTLTFEDRVVALLRRYDKPRKTARDRVTRAQFIRSLVREVEGVRIPFIAPELKVRQPIRKQGDVPRDDDRDRDREPGFSRDVHVNVKGVRADAAQLRVLETVLDVGREMQVGLKLMHTAIMVVIVESAARNLPGGDRDSVGAFQQRGFAPWTKRNRRDVAAAATTFYEQARKIDRPGMPAREVAWRTQQPREDLRGRYHDHRGEAERIVDAYLGGNGSLAGGGVRYRTKRYQFTRGDGTRRENSWEAMQRLAQEVRWRLFVDRGRVYFMDDATLLASRPRATFRENRGPVGQLSYTLRPGARKGPAQASVEIRSGRWRVAPGTAVVVRDAGPANGRWLVESIRRSVFSKGAEVTLRRPQRELPEPAPERERVETDRSGGAGGGSAGGGSGEATGAWIWPCRGPITGQWNEDRGDHRHDGVDIAAPTGTAVVACDGGRVTRAGWNGGYGWYIEIAHGDGLVSFYGHLSSIRVKSGLVSKGQRIGAVGSTGHSTGPHLHWGAHKNGASVDPRRYL